MWSLSVIERFHYNYSLIPRPHSREWKRPDENSALSWFLQAQQFCFHISQSGYSSMVSCDVVPGYEAMHKVSHLGLELANQNTALLL